MGHYWMDAGMLELVQKILWATGFLAVGGTCALIFVLVFAPSLFGAKAIQKQLQYMSRQLEKISEQLGRMGGATGSERQDDKKT